MARWIQRHYHILRALRVDHTPLKNRSPSGTEVVVLGASSFSIDVSRSSADPCRCSSRERGRRFSSGGEKNLPLRTMNKAVDGKIVRHHRDHRSIVCAGIPVSRLNSAGSGWVRRRMQATSKAAPR